MTLNMTRLGKMVLKTSPFFKKRIRYKDMRAYYLKKGQELRESSFLCANTMFSRKVLYRKSWIQLLENQPYKRRIKEDSV